MKRFLCAVLTVCLVFGMGTVCTVGAADEIVLTAESVSEKNGAKAENGVISGVSRTTYVAFADVDLTGVKSVWVNARNVLNGNANGETLVIVADNVESGQILGTVTLTESGEDITAGGAIASVSGKHKIYIRGLYTDPSWTEARIKSVTFSKEEYKSTAREAQISDDNIKDVWADTWVATDDMGRKVADFEEVGDVKTDTREVGLVYWDWFNQTAGTRRATVISDIVNAHPEEKENYTSPVWDTSAVYYWAEPVLGFYTSYDYWVYRKHAEMLSIAGVDAIFFDYSNGGKDYIPCLNVLAQAFRDSKASGVDIPRISAMMTLGGDQENIYEGLVAIYYNCFAEHDYSDIWYYYEDKPLLYGNVSYEQAIGAAKNDVEKNVLAEIKDFFTVRKQGGRNRASDANEGAGYWMWLENFPQILRNPDETGRPEFVVVGVGINQSTLLGLNTTGVFSDEYCKGRGYSEVFGEDYRDIGKRKAYFFREQAALALDAEPEFLMIDGWNEWTALRQSDYNGFKNSFVDLYDEENSRDFEPTRGALKDDYYNLMVDMIRKFKGVRKAPTASGMKTIDVNADASQWNEVGPTFYNNYQDYERDSDGLSKSRELAGETFTPWHYTTTVNNSIKSAKASFDNDNIYFMAETEKDIKIGTDNWMHLFINIDRNRATGWEGYDFAVNVGGAGAVSSYNNGWTKIADAAYSVKGNVLQLAVPRSVLGETGTVDLEFKWTDSVGSDDLLNFYSDGSSAPLGRFNYLYTEIEQTALSESERNALSGTTVIKAGSNKMVVSGGKMTVYEADTRITPFEANGTLYIPEEAFNEVMGFGRTKTRYEAAYNMLLTYHYDMNDALTEVENYTWTNGVLGSAEISVNGRTTYLSAAPYAVDGIIYIPLSMIEQCYGKTVGALGNGAYVISDGVVSEAAVASALAHIG